jgi:hypothetical protein
MLRLLDLLVLMRGMRLPQELTLARTKETTKVTRRRMVTSMRS